MGRYYDFEIMVWTNDSRPLWEKNWWRNFLTQWNFFLNDEQEDYITKKYNLDPNSNLSLAVQIKNWLLSEEKTEDYKLRIDRQKFLKLVAENWQLYKSSGLIFEEAKAIILGEKEPLEPTLQDLKPFAESTKGLDQFNGCFTCTHQHTSSEPKVCREIGCNCGIRG